jgi:hypothetical protein
MKKRRKKQDKKVLIGIGVGAIVLLVILIMFTSDDFSIGDKDISEATLNYVSYEVIDESLLKENCPAVNVGRCDVFGGEIGANCFTREVDLFFNVEGISYQDITCNVKDRYKDLGQFSFVKKDSMKYLPIKVDIRKYNEVTVCCKSIENPTEICTDPIAIESVC